ncbi:MAG: hypothetical protein P4L98_18075 [Ancalomicrobiaceae bacterium]|nr:hypothetical protein [Ancalomicrobiaceae bacterium]
MALMSHLIKDRHGTYDTRRIIPPALHPFMPDPWRDKSESKRTLGTKDPKEARRANIAMLARMDAAFAVAEARQKAAVRENLSDEEIKALAEWYDLEQISRDTAFREADHAEDEAIYAEVRVSQVATELRMSIRLIRRPDRIARVRARLLGRFQSVRHGEQYEDAVFGPLCSVCSAPHLCALPRQRCLPTVLDPTARTCRLLLAYAKD